MRIKIEKITFFDFLLTKMSTDKLNITASFLIVYAYVMLKLRYNVGLCGSYRAAHFLWVKHI